MRIVTGLFAILLGFVGVLVALAITGAVWFGAFALTAQTEKATAHADKALVQVEEGLGALKEPLVSTTKSVEEVRTSATTASAKPNAQATKAEVEQLRSTLLSLIDRTEVMGAALPPIVEMLDNAANLADKSGNAARATRLRATATNLSEATKELEAIRARAATIREGEQAPSAREIANLAQQAQKPLDRLTTAVSDVKKESEGLRGELPELRRTFNGWVYMGSAILTGILLWIGWGQLALIGWGRRRLSSPAPTATQPAPPAK